MQNTKNIIIVLLLGLLVFLLFKPQSLFQNTQPIPSNKTYQLSAMQSDVEKIVEEYQPVVVSIVATKDVPVIKRCIPEPGMPFFEDPFFGDLGITRRCIVENEQVETSGGTGFAVDSQGIILTNRHVVGDPEAEYTVLFNDETEEKVINIFRDPNSDVALVKINRSIGKVANLGDSNRAKPGQFVVAIGNALGEFSNTTSFGIISGLDRTIIAGDQTGAGVEKLGKVIQTDAAINPGNSGGPLININGEVIAMNTAKADAAENIGFAIPINSIKPIIQNFVR